MEGKRGGNDVLFGVGRLAKVHSEFKNRFLGFYLGDCFNWSWNIELVKLVSILLTKFGVF